jgi:hypothetical protein
MYILVEAGWEGLPSKEVTVIKVGDTIRIHDDAKVHEQLRGLLAVVTETRSWGVLADIPAPQGVYPVRLASDDYTVEEWPA